MQTQSPILLDDVSYAKRKCGFGSSVYMYKRRINSSLSLSLSLPPSPSLSLSLSLSLSETEVLGDKRSYVLRLSIPFKYTGISGSDLNEESNLHHVSFTHFHPSSHNHRNWTLKIKKKCS